MAGDSLHSSIHHVLLGLKVREVEAVADAELLARYATSRDEAAFTALVSRHGPTVLSVCRRVLRDPADVDDAFQATFLALAKQAGSIRRQEGVGPWLYEVAYHTALKARARRARREQVEQAAAPPEGAGGDGEVVYRDFQQVLDEELHKLPERLRQPMVLVHLLGRIQADAARELGITDRALRKRLQSGRERLRARLTRRGVSLTAAALAAALDRQATAGPVAPELVRPTVESILAYSAGQTAAVPAATVSLAMAGVGGWLAGRFKLVGLLLAVPVLAAVVFAAHALTPTSPAPALPRDRLAPEVADVEAPDGRTRVLTGQVLDADGRPVPHAAVAALARRPWQPADRGLHDRVLAQGTAAADGRYRLAVPADFPAWSADRRVTLVAHAPGRAPGTAAVPLRGRSPATDLRLPGTAAAHGRLVGPNGQPAAGVRLAVVRMGTAVREITQGADPPPPPPGWPADVLTDATGHFRLHGLPAGEPLWLQVQDDRYALTTFPTQAGAAEPATVTLAGPRLLTGRVVAEDTGRPLGGARIAVVVGPERTKRDHYVALAVAADAAPLADPLRGSPAAELDGRADADGRFRLRLPPEAAYHVYFYPPEGAAYIGRHWRSVWSEGETAREHAVSLPAGVEVRGEVVEEDGRPIDGACVSYVTDSSRGDPAAREKQATQSDQYLFSGTATLTGADGHFRLVVPAVPCLLNVLGPTADYRLHDYTARPCLLCGREDMRGFEHAQRLLDFAPSARTEPVRVTLRRGTTVAGRAVGPDGAPIRDGALVCRTVGRPLMSAVPRSLPIRDGAFALPGCVPGRVYPVLLLDAARQLAAVAEVHVPAAGEPPPPPVRLAPCGTAAVRLCDAVGRPHAGQRPFVQFWLGYDRPADEPEPTEGRRRPSATDPAWVDPRHYLPGPVTDAEGVLALPALVPGLEYTVSFVGGGGRVVGTKPFRVAPGQAVRLPDLAAPPEPGAGGHAGDRP